MDRMKTFKWYLIIFVSLVVVINLLTYGMMIRPTKELKYQVTFDSPKFIVTDTQTSYSHGYIKGKITNDTGNFIDVKYLKFEFYNEKGTYLATMYKELKYFYESETIPVDIEYNYKNVDSVRISLSNEQVERDKTEFEKTVIRWWPIIGIVTLVYLLP